MEHAVLLHPLSDAIHTSYMHAWLRQATRKGFLALKVRRSKHKSRSVPCSLDREIPTIWNPTMLVASEGVPTTR